MNNYWLEFTTYDSDGWEAAQSYPTEEEARKGYDAAKAAMEKNDPAVENWSGIRLTHYVEQYARVG